MRKAKKAVSLGLVLVITAMMCIPANSILFSGNENESKIVVKKLNIPGCGGTMKGHKIENALKSVALPLNADTQVTSSDEDEKHPTIAVGSTGEYLVAYERAMSLTEHDIWISVSTDGGNTWEELGSLNVEGTYRTYPSFDYRDGTTYCGTFTPDPTDDDGGVQYVFFCHDITDPGTWEFVYWTWGTYYGCYDRTSSEIACDTYEGSNDWQYGVIAIVWSIGNWEVENVPSINYAASDQENYGYFYEYDMEGSANPAIDIDRITHQMYAAFDWHDPEAGVRNIIVITDDYTKLWPIDEAINLFQISSENNNVYPTVAADDDNVMILAQTDENGNHDIICYYSSDGGRTFEESMVAASDDDEISPDVVSTGGMTARCVFIKNGDIYFIGTEDGGATWSEPTKVNDVDGNVAAEYRASSICEAAVAWSDNRNGNLDVYFDTAAVPIINIESISGGIGVKTTVTNIGGADAQNIEWGIVFDGPVFIGKEKSGTVTIPAGGSATIQSGFIFGIGPTTVTVTVGSKTKTASCFVLGPLVLGVK